MKKITSKLAIILASTLSLAACQSATLGGTKQNIGTLGGAVAGGLLGSQIGGGSGQIVATGAGALLGAFLGAEIGASLDSADQAALNQASSQASTAPIGQQISWNNPQSGNHGTITPTNQGVNQVTGQTCREYSQTIVVQGRQETAVGVACQNPDGTWSVAE